MPLEVRQHVEEREVSHGCAEERVEADARSGPLWRRSK